MGGLLSKTRAAASVRPRRVALVGLSETGKSHFLSVLCGDGTEVSAPTNGLDRVLHRVQGAASRGSVEFVEFGWIALQRGANADFQTENQPFDTIVWFIDEHDTRIDLYEARSVLLAFLETQPTASLSLCIVINKGRPRTRRRLIEHGRWTGQPDSQPPERLVHWTNLSECCDLATLRQHFGGGIYATELSYRDPQAAALCLDWILDPTTTTTTMTAN